MTKIERGPILAELNDGTKIYRNGILKSEVFFEVKFLNITYESTYDLNSGSWGKLTAKDSKYEIPIGGASKIELAPGEDGDLVFNGGQVGPSAGGFDAALVYDKHGNVDHLLLSAGIQNKLGGISFGIRIRDDGTSLSSYNTITVNPDGGYIAIEHYPGDAQYPYVKVKFTIYDANGLEINTAYTNIADPKIAADMASGRASIGVEKCFLSGTLISMSDGSTKRIEDIQPDDQVLSYDASGALVPGRVVRTFRNEVKHILDVFGLMVTPGHSTLCGEGKYAGRHVPILDILRTDGALVKADGTLIRVATGCEVGSYEDGFVHLAIGELTADGTVAARHQGKVRIGTRFITDDGKDLCIADLLAHASATVGADGLILGPGIEEQMPLHLSFLASVPEPEDYILARSGLTLEQIYHASEWEEGARPMTFPPMYLDGGPVQPAPLHEQQVMPRNVPLALRTPRQPAQH